MRRGFSLIEVVVVMMIMVAVALIAVPRLAAAGFQGRLNGVQTRLVYEFEAAADRCIDRGRAHTIVFDLPSHEMRIYEGSGASKGALVRTIELDAEPYTVQIKAVSISDAKSYIDIDAFGVYSATATVTVTANGQDRTVSLSGPLQGAKVLPDPDDTGPVKLLDGLIKGMDIL